MANFINYLSSSSPLLLNDTSGNLFKSAIDQNKLNAWGNPLWYSSNCCDLNGYDYLYSLSTFGQTNTKNFSDINTTASDPGLYFPYFDQQSYCYQLGNYLQSNSIDSLVNICNGNSCNLGIENLTVTKTPLSEIAYWLSRACALSDQSFNKTVLLDPSDVNYVTIDTDKKEVCMFFRSGPEVCKKYYCDSQNVDVTPKSQIPENDSLKESDYQITNGPSFSCFGVRVRLDVQNGFKNVYFDNLYSSFKPTYVWMAPDGICHSGKWYTCFSWSGTCTCSQPSYINNQLGDIASNFNTCASAANPPECKYDVLHFDIADVHSDVILNHVGDAYDNYYFNGNHKDNEVSSVVVNKHSYLWESVGDYSGAIECCQADKGTCNSDNNGGFRQKSFGLLRTDMSVTIGNTHISDDSFRQAWCGGKSCLLCAPDNTGGTTWYVCPNDNTKSYSGIEEVTLGSQITAGTDT